MKKITLFVAALMASAAMFAEGTFKVEKVWENLTVPASAEVRQGTGRDNQVFVVDKAAKKIQVVTKDGVADYATVNDGVAVGIGLDDAGNVIVKNEWASTGSQSIQICKKEDKTVTTVQFADSKLGKRSDLISAVSGDVFSAEGGHVYISLGEKGLLRIKVANGAFVELDTVAADWATNSIVLALPTADGLLVQTRSSDLAMWDEEANETKGIVIGETAAHSKSTAGISYFELGGKKFYALNTGTNYASAWNLYNATDDVLVNDKPMYVGDGTKLNSSSYANFLTSEIVDENTVNIYQYHPGNGAAMYKVTYTPGETTAVENNVVAVKAQKVMIDGQVYMVREGKTFNMLGQEVK